MNNKKHNLWTVNKGTIVLALALLLLSGYAAANSLPRTPTNATILFNTTPDEIAGGLVNMTGGSITIINVNVTSQNFRWKAIVGNITGKFTLSDAYNNSLFDWTISTMQGEIYATRYAETVDWSSIACAGDALIAAEEKSLNHTAENEDRISQTFSGTTHSEFYVGINQITAGSCYAIQTNVNNSVDQTNDFQEILLTDGTNLLYSSLLENNTYGYNYELYDFQMLLPAYALEGNQSTAAYYLYIELS